MTVKLLHMKTIQEGNQLRSTNPYHVRLYRHRISFHVEALCDRYKVKQRRWSRQDGDLRVVSSGYCGSRATTILRDERFLNNARYHGNPSLDTSPPNIKSIQGLSKSSYYCMLAALRLFANPGKYEARSLPHVEQHNVSAHDLLLVFLDITQLYILPTLLSSRHTPHTLM